MRRCGIKSSLLLVIIALPLCTFPCQSFGQITVTDVIYYFEADAKPVHNAIVRNNGKEPMYVTVQVFEVVRPGFQDEKRIESTDLIASPRRASIPAGGERTVRLLLRKRGEDSQKVYRVRYVPQIAPFDAGDTSTQRSIALRVITGIGMLIFVDPAISRPKLSWERKGGMLRFVNEGNVNVHVLGQVCSKPPANKEALLAQDDPSCESLPLVGRLYPGNEKTVKVPGHKTVVVTKSVNEAQEKIVIPPEAG